MKLDWIAVGKWAAGFGVTLLAVGLLALPARADTISVFADLPVAMSLKLDDGQGNTDSKDATGLSGYKLGVTLPFFVGLAYESYGSKFASNKVIPTSFNYDVTMYDLFFNLPLPIVNIAAGAGLGTGRLSNVTGASFKDAALAQWFASLGYNIVPLVDVHFGYHSFSGTNKGDTPAGVPDIKVNGDMWSLGVKIGF